MVSGAGARYTHLLVYLACRSMLSLTSSQQSEAGLVVFDGYRNGPQCIWTCIFNGYVGCCFLFVGS